MKKTILIIVLSISVGLAFLLGQVISGEAAKPTKPTCATCHPNFSQILPPGHPQVAGKGIDACTPCHKPDLTGKASANPYSARLHRAHQGKTECLLCHTWVPGKRFGLVGQNFSWGNPAKEEMALLEKLMGSWAASAYMDAKHGMKHVTCVGCHGPSLPKEGAEVQNDRCLACHGPLEKLQAKTAPADFPDRNPHKSHLGDVGCTVCHKGHEESAVYCLQCHPKFQMKLK